jgi:hypothetical protein
VEESTGLQRSGQTDPEEGTFSLALVTNWKLTSLQMQKLEESTGQTVNGLLFLMGNVLW